MQITALSIGLTNILTDETTNSGGPQEHPDVPSMLANNTESLRAATRGHIMTTILAANFGSLDNVKNQKVKNHKDIYEAARKVATAFTSAITIEPSVRSSKECKTLRLDISLSGQTV